MKTSSVFKHNILAYNANARYIVNKGSTRSGKTYSILQLLYLIARTSDKALTISIVSQSMPHLKKGCIRDFRDILLHDNLWNAKHWNATDKIYIVNKSTIEFFSADNPSKVHGPSRDILYINECINIEYEVYRQLAIRTTQTIFMDCNPCFRFWLDEKVLTQASAQLIHSTYRDNEHLSAAQIHEIESNRNDHDWWQVYGEGITGNRSGLVIQNWDIVSVMPDRYKKRWLGIDFGFTNDPTSIVDIRLAEGQLWIDELLYARGYDNVMIAKSLSQMNIPRHIDIVADSAEPKSIQEIRGQGWRIEPACKGRDSIATGIAILNRYTKHVSSNSVNIISEYRNYRWQTNEFGDATNMPIDRHNHAVDAQRYVCLNKLMEGSSSLNYGIIRGVKS